MKSLSKPLLIGGALTAIGLSTVAGVGIASAESGNQGDGLVDKIASTFNLNKNEVQKVFDEAHNERQAKHEERVNERLQKMVDEGAITVEQKSAIQAKLTEIRAHHDIKKSEHKNLSPEERKATMDEQRTQLESWAKEHDLDLSELRGIFRSINGHHTPGHEGPNKQG